MRLCVKYHTTTAPTMGKMKWITAFSSSITMMPMIRRTKKIMSSPIPIGRIGNANLETTQIDLVATFVKMVSRGEMA